MCYKNLSVLGSSVTERLNRSLNSCPLEKRFEARTESRGDTDSSTVKDTAFVVSRTVFITLTPLM